MFPISYLLAFCGYTLILLIEKIIFTHSTNQEHKEEYVPAEAEDNEFDDSFEDYNTGEDPNSKKKIELINVAGNRSSNSNNNKSDNENKKPKGIPLNQTLQEETNNIEEKQMSPKGNKASLDVKTGEQSVLLEKNNTMNLNKKSLYIQSKISGRLNTMNTKRESGKISIKPNIDNLKITINKGKDFLTPFKNLPLQDDDNDDRESKFKSLISVAGKLVNVAKDRCKL